MTVAKLRELDKESFALIGEAAKRKTTSNFFDVSDDPSKIIRDDAINLSRYNGSRGREQWDIIPDEVKAVWSKPEVRGIPKSFMLRDDENHYGFIIKNGAGEVTDFFVAHNNDHAALTAVHETGHMIDVIYLSDAQRKQILDVVKASKEYGTMDKMYSDLQARTSLTKREKSLLGKISELKSDEELIARSYTQFISSRNKGVLLEQFRKNAILSDVGSRYFKSVDTGIKHFWNEALKQENLL